MKSEAPAVFDAGEDILSLPLFQGVEAELLHELVASSRRTQHAKGTIFLAQGKPLTWFYIVLDGWCGASKCNPEGQDSILQIFRRGDFLPEPDHAVRMGTSPANLQALTTVYLLMLSPRAVRNALEQSADFMANMLTVSVRRSHELRDHIEQLTLHNAEQRMGSFLLQMRFQTSRERQRDHPALRQSVCRRLSRFQAGNPFTYPAILQRKGICDRTQSFCSTGSTGAV